MPASPVNKSRVKQMPIMVKLWLPVLLWMGFIFYASSIPGNEVPSLFPFQDIAFHLFIYLILSFFFARALKNTYFGITRAKIIVFTVIFGVIYGISDELHQAFVPYRTVSGLDLFIDTLGSFMGSLTPPFIKRYIRIE